MGQEEELQPEMRTRTVDQTAQENKELFFKLLADSNNLPLTLGAIEEHIKHARVQNQVWPQATNMQQTPFDPLKKMVFF